MPKSFAIIRSSLGNRAVRPAALCINFRIGSFFFLQKKSVVISAPDHPHWEAGRGYVLGLQRHLCRQPHPLNNLPLSLRNVEDLLHDRSVDVSLTQAATAARRN